MEVQIFGVRKNADTRKALRYFAERRIRTHFVDLTIRAASRGELQRFAQKFGVEALVDRESKRFQELGLHYSVISGDSWLQKLSDDPALLKLPLVRHGKFITVGLDEATWATWVAQGN